MADEVNYSEESRYCWECPKCGHFTEECEDPEEYGNDEAFCEECDHEVKLVK